MIIGIGIDVVDLERFEKTLARYGRRIINRLYTPQEQAYCTRLVSSVQEYAVRFAAKEAFLKAIGTGKSHQIRWRDIEIYNERSGKPGIRISGKAAEICSRLGGTNIFVSLSHSHKVAIAVVVIES
ncbi:holo-ACP synthase [Candidatus Sumerlaeota bacterium]|nr:holo-ACP synthase [Candidatus Sumerlaeota bacterium]